MKCPCLHGAAAAWTPSADLSTFMARTRSTWWVNRYPSDACACEPATGGQSNFAKTLADQHLATLFPSMLVRLPLIFKHNGLDTVATLKGFEGAAATQVPSPGRQLHLRPSEAYAYGRAYASLLMLEARLEDSKLGTLWTGEVRLSNGSGNPEHGVAAADRASLTLLTQLRDAQLIDISWRPLPDIHRTVPPVTCGTEQ